MMKKGFFILCFMIFFAAAETEKYEYGILIEDKSLSWGEVIISWESDGREGYSVKGGEPTYDPIEATSKFLFSPPSSIGLQEAYIKLHCNFIEQDFRVKNNKGRYLSPKRESLDLTKSDLTKSITSFEAAANANAEVSEELSEFAKQFQELGEDFKDVIEECEEDLPSPKDETDYVSTKVKFFDCLGSFGWELMALGQIQDPDAFYFRRKVVNGVHSSNSDPMESCKTH